MTVFVATVVLGFQEGKDPYPPGTAVKLGDGLYRREVVTGEKSGDLLAKLGEVSVQHRAATEEWRREQLEDSMRWLWQLFRKSKRAGEIIVLPAATNAVVVKKVKTRNGAGGDDYSVRITSGRLTGKTLRWNSSWMESPLLLEKCYVRDLSAFSFSEYGLQLAVEASDRGDMAVLRGLVASERITPLAKGTGIELIGWTDDHSVNRFLVLSGRHKGKKLFGQEHNVAIYWP